jgi:hypothetical protein
MKVSRLGPTQRSGSPVKASEVAGNKGKVFAAKLHLAERAHADTAVRAGAAAKPAAVADIGAALKAGKLTPAAAIDKVVERVLNRQLGRSANASVRAQVGAALREALADDPLLAAKVRALSHEG